MMLRKIAVIVCLSIALASCATVFGDNTRKVTVKSEPPTGKIYVDGTVYGSTPGAVLLPGANYSGSNISIRIPGYESQTYHVSTKFQNVGYWNLLCPAGFLFDYLAGTMYKINPKDRYIVFEPHKVVVTSSTSESKTIHNSENYK